MILTVLQWSTLFAIIGHCKTHHEDFEVDFSHFPAPDSHRCGVCPTYVRKICAFDVDSNSTYIFDNHCIMDLMNCLQGSDFTPLSYEHCLYFGNFAYIHGFKYEDQDYDESHIIMKGSKKNPDFV